MRTLWLVPAMMLLSALDVKAQPPSAHDSDIINIYHSQLKESLSARGMSDTEITTYLARSGVSTRTVRDFAQYTGSLYSYEAQHETAFLFFVFNHDTLNRYFIKDGNIVEHKLISITKKQLEQLNSNVYRALGIAERIATRAPRPRGLQPQQQSPSSINLDEAIARATDVLLPSDLDTAIRELIIIPSFSIGTFPFQLLRPYADGKMLIDRCTFTIAPSLVDLFAIRKRITNQHTELTEVYKPLKFAIDNVLFISNPTYPTDKAYIFPDLPGAKKEVGGAIRYAKKYTLLEGKAATKTAVVSAIPGADIVYFATHAMSSEENPRDNNYLVLSGNKDPFLTTRDIMKLRDSSGQAQATFPSLVILSACQTGLGKSMEAGITAGVSRAFLIAGASQVIMSLWNVDDDATSFLMNRFLFHLQQENKHSPSEPLRLAQLETRERYNNPVYWAGFAVYGVTY